MSRGIRFRGIHPQTKEVMDVCVIDWMHDEVWFEQGTDVSYPIADCNLIQFIGLKDIKGVDIYEGDKFHDGVNYCQILWCEDTTSFVAFDGFENHELGEHTSRQEIIGNLHSG